MANEHLETAVRVWTEPYPEVPQDTWPRPRYVLVLDCETSIDEAQRLTFGSYRSYRVSWDDVGPTLVCVEEGIFYGDDLPKRDPEAMEVLRAYVATHAAAVDPGMPGGLKLLSRAEFSRVLWQESYKKRATLVGFNLPFDLSRLAVGWGEARGRFHGGHS